MRIAGSDIRLKIDQCKDSCDDNLRQDGTDLPMYDNTLN